MNFKTLYEEAEQNARLALLSFWTPGHHAMRPYVERVLDKEPLMAEPVVQSMFPWRTSTDDTWSETLNHEVIERLEVGKKFRPYAHQTEAWRQASEGRSIVVTSGTGSGKTECFMLPVLSDIVEHRDEGGIQALFLYPLNALMEDQKKRLDEACQRLRLTFASYNGSTPEKPRGIPTGDEARSAEIVSREEIRQRLPHIMLTNPSMLEYILVRSADQPMLAAARGRLRWIVIDEAHTYRGSAALELSLQIRRILEAFGTDLDHVRFACTSATMGGSGSQRELRSFIAALTGQKEERIAVVDGHRQVPPIAEKSLRKAVKAGALPDAARLMAFRKEINRAPAMRLADVWRMLRGKAPYSAAEALGLLDSLAELSVDGVPLLAVRCHTFMRTVSGLFACGNAKCAAATHPQLGHITTRKAVRCTCGSPLFELVQCKQCATFLIAAEEDAKTHALKPRDIADTRHDYFSLDTDSDDDLALFADEPASPAAGRLLLAPVNASPANVETMAPAATTYVKPVAKSTAVLRDITLSADGARLGRVKTEGEAAWRELRDDKAQTLCPVCGTRETLRRQSFKPFRVSTAFLGEDIAPVLLRECAAAGTSWGKYLAFTDSRQGTATSAKGFNIAVERTQGYKQALAALRKKEQGELTPEQQQQVDMLQMPEEQKEMMRQMFRQGNRGNDQLTIREFADVAFSERLFRHLCNADNLTDADPSAYKNALVRMLLGRRTINDQSAESMGLFTLNYSGLGNATLPHELEGCCTRQDWVDFLKITLDFFVRQGNHIQPICLEERPFLRGTSFTKPVAPPDNSNTGLSHWPTVAHGEASQSRLVRLLCAAMSITTPQQLEARRADVDSILRQAYNQLVENKVLAVQSAEHTGFNYDGDGQSVGCAYLDMSLTGVGVSVSRTKRAWICPVTGGLLDTLFCGYAPTMPAGEISARLFARYKVTSQPIVPGDTAESYGEAWTARHHLTFDYSQEPYIAAEHSGQMERDMLRKYTAQFQQNPPQLNVLQCSTTMEMGVDIGDIDLVLLNSVPPTPANYAQRVGRAGRAGQTKAAALTLLGDTPTARGVFLAPMTLVAGQTASTCVQPSAVIEQRHRASWLFRHFINQDGEGMRVATHVGEFMDANGGDADRFIEFLAAAATAGDLRDEWQRTFPALPYNTDKALSDMTRLRDDFRRETDALEQAFAAAKDKRQTAIRLQVDRIKRQNLLQWLTTQQLLPNASMPASVVTFNYMDKDRMTELNKVRTTQRRLNTQLKNTNLAPTARENISKKKAKVDAIVDCLRDGAETSREASMALSEYAPEQMVVIDERNYRSAGLIMCGAFQNDTQQRFLYFCKKCGRVEHTTDFDEHRVCPDCHAPYSGILDRSDSPLTRTYEAIGFRTDSNVSLTRTERAQRRYYDIRPLLLSHDRQTVSAAPYLTELYPSHEGSELLFYNAGTGCGFALCPACGRAALETAIGGPLPDTFSRHRRLDCDELCGATADIIARNVVLTARHPTDYTVLALLTGNGSTAVNDESLVTSLGVLLRRALTEELGIDDGEIDFGTRQERDRWLLFIYDTARGGCGYSLRMSDPTTCQRVLTRALSMLRQASCNCEDTDGACQSCLMDRTTTRVDSLLSKRKALEWLTRQSRAVAEPTTEARQYSPSCRCALTPLLPALTAALAQPQAGGLTLTLTDNGDVCFQDVVSRASAIGRLIADAVTGGHAVTVNIAYSGEQHCRAIDVLPFLGVNDKFADCTVHFVKPETGMATAATVSYGNAVTRFFTPQLAALGCNGEWGKGCDEVYVDNSPLLPAVVDAPTLPTEERQKIRSGAAGTDISDVPIDSFWSKIIMPATGLTAADMTAASECFRGREATVTVSDPYLTTPLSALIVTGILMELREMLGFNVARMTVYADSKRRRDTLLNKRYVTPAAASRTLTQSFADEEEADKFLLNRLRKGCGVRAAIAETEPGHVRFMRIEAGDESFEVRPDHGFAGRWTSRQRQSDVGNASIKLSSSTRSEESDEIYYVLM